MVESSLTAIKIKLKDLFYYRINLNKNLTVNKQNTVHKWKGVQKILFHFYLIFISLKTNHHIVIKKLILGPIPNSIMIMFAF
jgi:hypothetical protein